MTTRRPKTRKTIKRQRLFRRYTGYHFCIFQEHLRYLDIDIVVNSFFKNRKAKALLMEKAILIDLITLITKPIK